MKSSLITICVIAAAQLICCLPVDKTGNDLNPHISHSLQNVLKNTHGGSTYEYPTDLTRDIIPKPIHSHNDYWRDVPFFSALSVGAISVEADVWLFDDDLFVGHDVLALTHDRTFDSLYVQPILDVLNRQNPKGVFVPSTSKHGVFDTSSEQTLYLFVECKTDGSRTWPHVVEALKPLRDAGYLTTFDGTTVKHGPVTVIGTGQTPLDQIEHVSPRDYFYDANAALLDSDQSHFTSSLSPIASLEFSRYVGAVSREGLNQTQIDLIRSQIAGAQSKGIGVRYWDTPAFPVSTRNSVWQTLVEEGVALLNADDLAGAAGMSGPASW